MQSTLLMALGILLGTQFAGTEMVDRKVTDLPGIGRVTITSSAPVGGFPTITITDSQNNVVMSRQVGTDRAYGFRVAADEEDTKPRLRFAVLPGPDSSSKAILAVAMFVGGSDCGYEGIILGAHGGQIANWSSTPVFTNVEGGVYVGELGGERGYGVAEWGFVWGKNEAHLEAHRYKVILYRYDQNAEKMVRFEELTTKQKYESDAAALAELNLHYPNLLRLTKDFKC